MRQPDTAALRERLANYTPEEELKQDLQEFDGLLQEVNSQMVELRNLLKEIHALKEELHDNHTWYLLHCYNTVGFQQMISYRQ